MNLERWTQAAREALAQAQVLAQRMKHQAIDLPHLWAVLLKDEGGLACPRWKGPRCASTSRAASPGP